MSRGFRALKVWMALRFFGARGLRGRALEEPAAWPAISTAWSREHPDFEVLHEPSLYIYCFRFVPQRPRRTRRRARGRGSALDRLNQAIAERVQRSGLALVMTTRIRGRVALRMSICSHRTREEDVEATFEAIAAAGRRLASARTALQSEEMPC